MLPSYAGLVHAEVKEEVLPDEELGLGYFAHVPTAPAYEDKGGAGPAPGTPGAPAPGTPSAFLAAPCSPGVFGALAAPGTVPSRPGGSLPFLHRVETAPQLHHTGHPGCQPSLGRVLP